MSILCGSAECKSEKDDYVICRILLNSVFIKQWAGSRAITHTEARTAASAQDKRHFTCIDWDNICLVLHDVHANFDNDDGSQEAVRLRGVGCATWSGSNLLIYCLQRKCWFRRCLHCVKYHFVTSQMLYLESVHDDTISFYDSRVLTSCFTFDSTCMLLDRSWCLHSIAVSTISFFFWFDITLFLIFHVVQMTIRIKSA